MISVQDAKNKIAAFHRLMETIQVPLLDSTGYALASDITALIALPFFHQSSVDGYALAFSTDKTNEYELITGESAAGSPSNKTLQPGQALRVFTGSSIPAGTDAVVMQEKIRIQGNILFIDSDSPESGLNIRKPGSDLQLHEKALSKGVRMNPAKIGLLAALGFQEIPIHKAPSVSILITGNEFIESGDSLEEGKIYETNSFILQSALKQIGVHEIHTEWIRDDPQMLLKAMNQALTRSDLVLITGGVSVGDYDFTVQTAELAGAQKIFHQIAQRPGKPLYFGIKDRVFVFGLPGNMSSVLTCFYIYIVPLIASMMHLENPVKKIDAVLSESVKSPEGLTSFWKGFYQDGFVKPLPGQESYKLKSFADANCLIEIPEQITSLVAGTKISIYLIPEN